MIFFNKKNNIKKQNYFDNKVYVPVKISNNQNCVNCGAPLSAKGTILKCDYCGQYHNKPQNPYNIPPEENTIKKISILNGFFENTMIGKTIFLFIAVVIAICVFNMISNQISKLKKDAVCG